MADEYREVLPGVHLSIDPAAYMEAVDSDQADQEERESILAADHEIQMAQYRELHNRLEDYTRWMIQTGFLAQNAIAGPALPPSRSDFEDFLFEHIEAYLDQANEHEDRGPLEQILHPDLEVEED